MGLVKAIESDREALKLDEAKLDQGSSQNRPEETRLVQIQARIYQG